MRAIKLLSAGACAVLLVAAGCQSQHQQKPAPTAAFKNALDTYYQSHPSCIWSAPQQLPIDLDERHPDPAQEQQLEALRKAGLLDRKTGDKEVPAQDRHRRHRERVYEYNLTDKGKSAWSADNSQSGAGNFCVGSPHVISIDKAVPAPNTSRYSVSYHFALGSLPAWAQTPEVLAAFPSIAAENSEKQITALANLSKTDGGWTASGIQPVFIAPPPKASS